MFLFRLVARHYMLAVTYLLVLVPIAVLNWSLVWHLFDNPLYHLLLLGAYVLAQRAEYIRKRQLLNIGQLLGRLALIAFVYYLWMAATGDVNYGAGPWRSSDGNFQHLGALLLASSQYAFCLSLGAWLWARSSNHQPSSSEELEAS